MKCHGNPPIDIYKNYKNTDKQEKVEKIKTELTDTFGPKHMDNIVMNEIKDDNYGYKRMIEEKYMFNVETKNIINQQKNENVNQQPQNTKNGFKSPNFTNEYTSPMFHKIKPDISLQREFHEKFNSSKNQSRDSTFKNFDENKNILQEKSTNRQNIFIEYQDNGHRVSKDNDSLFLGDGLFEKKCYHLSQYEMNSIKNSLKIEQNKLDNNFDSFNDYHENSNFVKETGLQPIQEK